MDTEEELFHLPAPLLQPRLPHTCPTAYVADYRPITAVEAGIPTAPTTTPDLTQEERKRRIVVYMVRYNRLEVWMKANISNIDASEEQLKLEFKYYDKIREKLQWRAIGNTIPKNGAPSWFMRHLLWAVSEDNFRTHLHNIRHYIRKYEQPAPGESEAARTARAQL
jgi:hypothetical protein